MTAPLKHVKSQLLLISEQVRSPGALVSVLFVFSFLIVSLFDESLGEVLEFNRRLIEQGEYWRILTGNYVHFGWYHTVMNSLSALLIGVFLFWVLPWRLSLFLLLIIPFLEGLSLYLFSLEIEVYRGFSGAVYGLALVGLVLNWRINPPITSLVIAGLLGKLIYERMPEYDTNFLIEEIGVPVAIDAHLWGAVAGVILLPLLWRKYSVQVESAS